MPTQLIANIQGSFPSDSTLLLEACNNGHDAAPSWEDITAKAQSNQKYFFQNAAKTAAQWGVDLCVTLERGTATAACIITSLGGAFK